MCKIAPTDFGPTAHIWHPQGVCELALWESIRRSSITEQETRWDLHQWKEYLVAVLVLTAKSLQITEQVSVCQKHLLKGDLELFDDTDVM